MIIPIHNKIGNYDEWCILEFQGEIVGDLRGKELGKLEIKEVRTPFLDINVTRQINFAMNRMAEPKWKSVNISLKDQWLN